MISLVHRVVHGAQPVGHRFPARDTPLRLHINAHRPQFQERRIDRHTHRQRVVNRSPTKPRALIQTHLKTRDRRRKFRFSASAAFDLGDLRIADQRNLRHVQPHHRHRPTGAKYEVGGIRIAIHVEFGCAIHVAAGN